MTALDLGSGSGEMLCTWARDLELSGTGVDLSVTFTAAARARAIELGVADRVNFIQADATDYTTEPVDLAACIGATWIGGGVSGTIELLARSIRPGGVMLIGEPFWRRQPANQQIAQACEAAQLNDYRSLPGLLSHFGELGYDVVQMALASQDDWDQYQAAQWLSMRTWLDANPEHQMSAEVRALLRTEPANFAQYTREYFGWGIFALRLT